MEKCYGEPKRARNWKRWIQPRGMPKVTRHSLTLHQLMGLSESEGLVYSLNKGGSDIMC
jgi:hypothetical protein